MLDRNRPRHRRASRGPRMERLRDRAQTRVARRSRIARIQNARARRKRRSLDARSRRNRRACRSAVGVLINNAGYGLEGAFEEVPMTDIRRQFETNVFGLIAMTQLVLPGMRRQRWGRVVNLSSMGGKLTFPGGALLSRNQARSRGAQRCAAFEVKGFGIDVIVIEPGPIKTPSATPPSAASRCPRIPPTPLSTSCSQKRSAKPTRWPDGPLRRHT